MDMADKRNATHDLQRIMFLVLLFVLHNESLAGQTQNQFAKKIGCSKAQISTAVNRIIDELQREGARIDSLETGVDSLIKHLRVKSNKLARRLSEEYFGHSIVTDSDDVFVPKVGWEEFLKRILPDIWHLDWVQDLWDVKKYEAWLRGRAGSEKETIKAALHVIDIDIQYFRPYMSLVARGWEHVASDFSEALPASIKRSLGFDSVIPTRRIEDDERLVLPRPKWLEYSPERASSGQEYLRSAIKLLAAGETPMLRFGANDAGWYVKRVRKFAGEWMLDTWNDVGEVRAWRIAEIGEYARIEAAVPMSRSPMIGDTSEDAGVGFMAPSWMDHEVPTGRVDHPGCMHLGQPRSEVFLLDYGEIKWPAVRAYFTGEEAWHKPMDTGSDIGTRPDDLPETWHTRRIFPRYSKQSASDPAWIEFVSILLQYTGKIRLRTPGHPDIESDSMLAFCTGPIDLRLMREQHAGLQRLEGGDRD